MNGRGRHVWLLCALVLFGAVTAMAQNGPPPTDLHLVGDHWTAWDPPVPAEGVSVYTIEAGDTLWAIAEGVLGDGHLWPQIWELNQYVLDAHWVYPGDPLILPGALTAGAEGVAGPPLDDADMVEDPFTTVADGSTAPPAGVVDSASALEAPVPLGYEADIYCTGFVGDLEEEFAYRVAASEYEFQTPRLDPQRASEIHGVWGKTDTLKYGLGMGDIVYLDGGRADGLSAGLLLTAIQPEHRIVHPDSGDTLGRFYHYMGRLRVLSVQEDSAIAEIVALCDPIPVGTPLRVFEPEPVPLRRITPLRPVNFPATEEEVASGGTIIAARDGIVALGAGHLVFIDRGSEQDVAPGDIYTIYRQGRRGFPPIVLGELGVLSVYKNSALARILRSRYTVFVGDALVLK